MAEAAVSVTGSSNPTAVAAYHVDQAASMHSIEPQRGPDPALAALWARHALVFKHPAAGSASPPRGDEVAATVGREPSRCP